MVMISIAAIYGAACFTAGALVMRKNYAWTKNLEDKAVRAAQAMREN